MKEKLKDYLEKYFCFWNEEFGTLPKVPFDEDLKTSMYRGAVDEDEYIEWMYEINTHPFDFEKIENKFNFKINKDLKEFFNSYYFLELQGFIDNELINIDSISEERDILRELEFILENESGDMIQIGITSPEDLPIYFENKSGEVYVVDIENNKAKLLCNSLGEMFNRMIPKKSNF